MGAYIEPFNLEKLFVGYFAGTPAIFAILLLLLVSFFAARYGLSLRIYLVLLFLATVIMAAFMSIWYIVIALILAFISFKVVSKLTQ